MAPSDFDQRVERLRSTLDGSDPDLPVLDAALGAMAGAFQER